MIRAKLLFALARNRKWGGYLTFVQSQTTRQFNIYTATPKWLKSKDNKKLALHVWTTC
jgi:hypothetical protein